MCVCVCLPTIKLFTRSIFSHTDIPVSHAVFRAHTFTQNVQSSFNIQSITTASSIFCCSAGNKRQIWSFNDDRFMIYFHGFSPIVSAALFTILIITNELHQTSNLNVVKKKLTRQMACVFRNVIIGDKMFQIGVDFTSISRRFHARVKP